MTRQARPTPLPSTGAPAARRAAQRGVASIALGSLVVALAPTGCRTDDDRDTVSPSNAGLPSSTRAPRALAGRYLALHGTHQLHAAIRTAAVDEGAVDSLRTFAELDPRCYVLVDSRSGRVLHAVGRLSEPTDREGRSVDPASAAAAFIVRHRKMLRLADSPTGWTLEKPPTTFRGAQVFRF